MASLDLAYRDFRALREHQDSPVLVCLVIPVTPDSLVYLVIPASAVTLVFPVILEPMVALASAVILVFQVTQEALAAQVLAVILVSAATLGFLGIVESMQRAYQGILE